MTKKNKIILSVAFLAALAGGASFLAQSKPAYCAWCPSYKCFARCSPQCACVTSGGSYGGVCVSVERVGEFLSSGYKELP